MNILLTGGTGLIGRHLCHKWHADGHRLWVLSRRPPRVVTLCQVPVQGIGDLREIDGQPLDAVVNLAGAPIADRPWTRGRKALLWDSRVTLTEHLLNWLERRENRPQVLISGSASGWYGDAGDRSVDEASNPSGADFAARLCLAWEAAAQQAEVLGMRVVRLRTGLVLARDGGFLKKLLPAFRLGLGGRLGNGRQWMPWVHIDDLVALIDFLLHLDGAGGPYNASAPQPVRNAQFTTELAGALHRPALFPVPAWALRALGELSILLLGGQQALPRRVQEAGFVFRYPDLASALADLFPSD